MNSTQLSSDTLPVRPGDVLAGKYRVEKVLGTGGMGFVVAARIINLGKLVALKMMLPAALAMPRSVERFEREARAAVQLKSEHIAEVLDIGRLPTGEPYIVMELLDGNDFEGLLQRDRWLQVEDAVDYVLQACEAVSEAHALGVVHRDLKPKNLFLSHRLDGTPIVKVLDFGISKWTTTDSDSHSLTKTTDVFGSPNYMSPEQIRSARDVDGRTDIWSLGVILFELLTGRVPFVAVSLPQLCALVLEQQAPAVSTLRADVPDGLVAVVARCLEKSCERRFQTVGELVAALLPFGRVQPQLRSTTGPNLSPSASTMPIVGPLVSRVPPAVSSAGGAHVISNGTSASWSGTPPTPTRGRGVLIGAIAAPVALLAVGAALWAGWHWRGTVAQPPPPDASAASTASAVASPPTSDPPPASAIAPSAVTAQSAAPPASAMPEAKSSPIVRRPLPPVSPTTGSRDAGSSTRPPVTPSASPTDPFQPVDRK
jgi:eukaryotic-like serine/threonine-protein kinase